MAITTSKGSYQDYAYTGGMQSVTIPHDGIYKFEVWGAGGSNSALHGSGNYGNNYNTNGKGIFDNCVMGYITIFTERDDKVAERNFKIALTDEHNIMSKTPSDYRLVRLARFDEKTGLFEEAKENIYDGISLSK